MSFTLYTVGHSNRKIEYLLQMLRAIDLQQLVDIRAYPGSIRHPQFASAYLQQALADSDIAYYWAGSRLGGMRKGRATSPHRAIASSTLRAYADYMETQEFRSAICELVDSASTMRTVLMCAEREPSRCHRSLISDYLSTRGIQVVHLIENDTIRVHKFHRLARRIGDRLIYDRGTTRELLLER